MRIATREENSEHLVPIKISTIVFNSVIALREYIIMGDFTRASWALVRAQLPWEHKEAIVTHKVAAGHELDQLLTLSYFNGDR